MIHAHKLRDLTLEPGGERPHLAAASGLVRVGEWLYVVADDESFLGVFPAQGDGPGRRLVFDESALPSEASARKAQKPDLEALAHLPARVWPPHGALLALGSGSTASRRRGALLPLHADGSAAAPPLLLDLTSLYAALEAEIPELNLEGAAASGDRLCLLQRGNGRAGVNAVVELDLRGACESASRSQSLPADLVGKIRRYDLGAHQGVHYTFTDASPLPDGRLLFSAVAEDCPDTYHDGPVVAAGLGVLDAESKVECMESLEPVVKIEGVHATLESNGDIALLLVADADDESRPAPLLSARLTGRAR